MLRRSRFGFTLAELLIALAILGEIATFTIPKILTSSQGQAKRSIVKEFVGTLSAVTYNGNIQGTYTESTFDAYLQSKINAVKLCPVHSDTQGCITQPVPHWNFSDSPGFVLHNGATVSCGTAGGVYIGYRECFIDWNGTAGPNLINEDQYVILVSFTTTYIGPPGKVINHSGWTSDALWQGFFQ